MNTYKLTERYKKESEDKYANVVCSDIDGNTYYTDEYVEWLEELVKKLTIPVVIVLKGTFCSLYNKECIGNICSVRKNLE